MRNWGIVLTILVATSLALARSEESLEQLKARAESVPLAERPVLYTRIAGRQLQAADKLYADGKVEEAQAVVGEVVTYSEKARDAAANTGKKLKHVEIEVRKLARRLADLKRTLAVEDQPPVQAAVDRLEQIRTELLIRMFGKGNK